MKLHYKEFGSGQPLIVLHGLMGMLDNWQGPAKMLAEHFHVIIADQRNHGHSPHSPDFTYRDMAADLHELITNFGFDSTLLLGHSMGGKTVMRFAQEHPEMVEKLIVADIAPREYPVRHQTILEALHAVNLDTVASRKEAQGIMSQFIAENGVKQFLLKNLYWKDKGQLAWRFNLQAITDNIELIGEEIDEGVYDKPTLFVRGEKSDYVQDFDWPDIQLNFPRSILETIPNAGHWVHAEAPKPFVSKVLEFLLD